MFFPISHNPPFCTSFYKIVNKILYKKEKLLTAFIVVFEISLSFIMFSNLDLSYPLPAFSKVTDEVNVMKSQQKNRRLHTCRKCDNHDLKMPIRGHAKCPFSNCPCSKVSFLKKNQFYVLVWIYYFAADRSGFKNSLA